MRLRSLTVEGIRAFQFGFTFDLNGDVVVISGRNGTGKTSLLDSIQWLILGEVPRLKATALRGAEDYVSNRYAATSPSVSGVIGSETEQVILTRTGGLENRLSIEAHDEHLSDEHATAWLDEVVGGSDGRAKLFQRMFLLQQDEIKEFVYAETKERYRFLADLAGVGALQMLDQEMRAQLKRLREAVRERGDRLQALEARVNALKNERAQSIEVVERQEDFMTARTRDAFDRMRTRLLGLDTPDVSVDALLRRAEELIATLDGSIGEYEAETAREQAALAQRSALRDAEMIDLTARIDETRERKAAVDAALAEVRILLDKESRRRERLSRLAVLALEELGERCPVCDQPHDPDQTRRHLENVIGDDTPVVALQDAVESRAGEAATLAEELHHLSDLQAEYRRRLTDHRAAEEVAKQAHLRAAAALERATTAATSATGHPVKGVKELRELRAELDRTVKTVARSRDVERQRVSVVQRMEALDLDVARQEEELSVLATEVSSLSRTLETAESVCQWLGTHIVDATATTVRVATPAINELYGRLDIHPAFRRFDFRSDRHYGAGHLRPWVYDDDRQVDGNAAQVLSSAQLNALAVCLFLALNLVHVPRFQSVMMDDPIQNMDDVNVLSLVDALRGLRQRRQVLITTHDVDLAQLLWRKLRPLERGERTIWINFSNWTRRGPQVSVMSRESKERTERLELVLD